MTKFQVGEKVQFKFYDQTLIGTIVNIKPKGYDIQTNKRDISRRTIPVLFFVKESNVSKIVVKEE